MADGKARVVVAVDVMPANEHDTERAVATVDQAITRTGQHPEAVCADSAYANGPNAAAMEARDVRLVSPPQRIKRRGTDDDPLTQYDFVYDAARDLYVCPAKQELTYIGTESTRKRRRYRAPKDVCTVCPLRSRCTKSKRRILDISPHHDALKRLREDAATDSFRELYRARAPVIEGVFAESKQWHGLRRAWRRGLSNMLMQSLLVASVLNFKRLMAAPRPAAIVSAVSAVLYACYWCLRSTRRRLGHPTRMILRSPWNRSRRLPIPT